MLTSFIIGTNAKNCSQLSRTTINSTKTTINSTKIVLAGHKVSAVAYNPNDPTDAKHSWLERFVLTRGHRKVQRIPHILTHCVFNVFWPRTNMRDASHNVWEASRLFLRGQKTFKTQNVKLPFCIRGSNGVCSRAVRGRCNVFRTYLRTRP